MLYVAVVIRTPIVAEKVTVRGKAIKLADVDACRVFEKRVQSENRSAAPPYEPPTEEMHWIIRNARRELVNGTGDEIRSPVPPLVAIAQIKRLMKVASMTKKAG